MAQRESGGTILGRITDPTGAGVAQAKITAIEVNTNMAVNATSNEDGNYQVPFLPAGDYNVAVEHAGFKTMRRQEVAVVASLELEDPDLDGFGLRGAPCSPAARSPPRRTAPAATTAADSLRPHEAGGGRVS